MKKYRKKNDISVPDEAVRAYFKAQVERPGIFFCIGHTGQWEEAETFIRAALSEFPRLKALVFFSRGKWKSKPEAAYLLAIDKGDFNLLGKEKPALRQWISQQDFDLLLVFPDEPAKRCKKLALSLPAKLTAGWRNENEEPWFNINLEKPKGEARYFDFYKTLKLYFKQLNINIMS